MKMKASDVAKPKVNEIQLKLAFEYLNVKEQHKAALTEVIIYGVTSYEAEKQHKLSPETIRPKVKRLEAYFESCVAFVSKGDSNK